MSNAMVLVLTPAHTAEAHTQRLAFHEVYNEAQRQSAMKVNETLSKLDASRPAAPHSIRAVTKKTLSDGFPTSSQADCLQPKFKRRRVAPRLSRERPRMR